MRARVLNEIDTTFASHYSAKMSLEEAMKVDSAVLYGARKTGQKTLLTLTDSAS